MLSSQTSNHKKAAVCLLSRGVNPSFVRWKGEGLSRDASEEGDKKEEKRTSAGDVAEPFLAALGCYSPLRAEKLATVFEAAHPSEKAFDKKLLRVLSNCVAKAISTTHNLSPCHGGVSTHSARERDVQRSSEPGRGGAAEEFRTAPQRSSQPNTGTGRRTFRPAEKNFWNTPSVRKVPRHVRTCSKSSPVT